MASISKNVYTDNSDDTTDKYNNTYHRTINVKPDDVKPSIYINIYIYISTLMKQLMINMLNLKMTIM